MPTAEQRDRVRERMLELAETDARVTAAAVVGSLADSEGDDWSDLDLTFGVAGTDVSAVLAAFTDRMTAEFGAAHLFDLPSRTSIYRVFLVPGGLQVDLSFTPERDFGPRGPRFRLLFGSIGSDERSPPPNAREMAGLAAHHAVRAAVCIARGRVWQAEYWLSAVRDYTLALACIRHGLEPAYGRGSDELPADLLAPAARALPQSIDPQELRRALVEAVAGLVRELDELPDIPAGLTADLRAVAAGESA
jgi:hypothetical protein